MAMPMPNVFSVCIVVCLVAIASGSGAGSSRLNFALGTTSMGGQYKFSVSDLLTETTNGIVSVGGNQMKLKLSDTSCQTYNLDCDNGTITSLKSLAMHDSFASTFSRPELQWYQFWLSSFSNPKPLQKNWTVAALEADYKEIKEWASYMLEKYSGSRKVFMAGNWEGDWMLMDASGCKLPDGKFNLTCNPTPEVIDRLNEITWVEFNS